MKFFVDTADTADIADLAATGLLDGVTTNPTLIHKSGRDFLDVVKYVGWWMARFPQRSSRSIMLR
jgi:transaldolase